MIEIKKNRHYHKSGETLHIFLLVIEQRDFLKSSKDIGAETTYFSKKLSLIDNRIPPIPTEEYVFFSSMLGTFTESDYKQSNKAGVNKFKRADVTQNKLATAELHYEPIAKRYLENLQMPKR